MPVVSIRKPVYMRIWLGVVLVFLLGLLLVAASRHVPLNASTYARIVAMLVVIAIGFWQTSRLHRDAVAQVGAAPPARPGFIGASTMPLISSRMTFFYKRVFPLICLAIFPGIFAVALFTVLLHAQPGGHVQAAIQAAMKMIAVSLIPSVLLFWFARRQTLALADEVLDAGDALLVRRGDQQERIAFSDIKSVSYVYNGRGPSKVTLAMRRLTIFGDSVIFQAPLDSVKPGGGPIVDNLTHRVEAASRER